MTANTYVNIRTMDILNKIDQEQLQKSSKTKNHIKPKQNQFFKDTYSKGLDITGQFQCMTYQKEVSLKNSLQIDIVKGFIPWELVDKLNDNPWYTVKDGVIGFDGFYFKKESIPPINQKNLTEIKAENNVISFNKCRYFKYVSKDGKEHYIQSRNSGLGLVSTELMRGEEYDQKAFHYREFWNLMMTVTGPGFPSKDYGYDVVNGYMEEAGIKPGFFTINMQDTSKTLFYSQNKVSEMVIRKKDYDHDYEALTQKTHLLNDFEPGSIFKIDGKEYVLKDNYTLDIPYGADIYSVEYPKKTQ